VINSVVKCEQIYKKEAVSCYCHNCYLESLGRKTVAQRSSLHDKAMKFHDTGTLHTAVNEKAQFRLAEVCAKSTETRMIIKTVKGLKVIYTHLKARYELNYFTCVTVI